MESKERCLALDDRRLAMRAAIAANQGHACDPAARFLLDGLTARLARLVAALERDLARPLGGPFGTAGRWGANGRGPEIDDLIRRSALAREPFSAARASLPSDPPPRLTLPPRSKGPA